jgi:hypothetical protein
MKKNHNHKNKLTKRIPRVIHTQDVSPNKPQTFKISKIKGGCATAHAVNHQLLIV